MKFTISTLLICCIVSMAPSAMAQIPGRPGMGGAQMNVGQFYGKILDDSTAKPIEGATVQLIQNKMDSVTKKRRDMVVGFRLTDKKGEFLIDQLPVMGSYKINISAIGYKTLEMKANFDINMSAARSGDYSSMMSGVVKDLGNLKLKTDAQSLEAVVVTSTKPLLEMGLDRKVYNVDKDLSATGGTAVDIMRNVPTLNVDIDGNVTMRNAAPQIFVDGRPTTLTLDQIPADQIATVELITNPSAKYDASGGGAGILNIVLKKNRRIGYNGSARASIDSRLRPGAGGDINVRQGKLNFFTGIGLFAPKSLSTSRTERIDYLAPDSISNLLQTGEPSFEGVFGFGRAGLDYFIDNRNTISISGNLSRRRMENADYLNIYRNRLDNGVLLDEENGYRSTQSRGSGGNSGASLNYKHNFAKSGKELTADINYRYMNNKNTADFSTAYFDINNNPKGPEINQRFVSQGNSRFIVFQSDYVDPLTINTKLEAGIRMANNKFNSQNDNFIRLANGDFLLIPALGAKYSFTDRVYAAYTTFSQKIKNFSYQAGLRVESSEYSGDFKSRNQRFGNEYPLSLFPSLYLSYKVNSKQDVQLNYSRRVNRPNFFQLIPFVDYTDSLNLSVGNPDLIPEFTNTVELGYSIQFNKSQNLFFNLYGKNTNNLITRYQYKDAGLNPGNTDSVIYTTFANANKSYQVGLEITSRNKLTKWWDINTNLNMYNQTIKASNLPGTTDSERFSWFAKTTNSFKLPKNFSVQFSADYQAKTLLPAGGGRGWFMGGFGQVQSSAQGFIRPIYGADLSIRKNFMKNNMASITVAWSDIFRTRLQESFSSSDFFIQDNSRRRDPQVVRVSFNYRFGKFDAALFKRKNIKNEMENMQNMQAE